MLRRKRIALDDDGKVKVLDHLPNNRLVNNIYAKMVDQKTNYSFGRPFSFDTENKAYAAALHVFGSGFQRTMHNIGEGAWIGGKSWVYPYYDQNGELAFQRFPADEVLPFGRMLTTPSWMPPSMSMWCWSTMKPNRPGCGQGGGHARRRCGLLSSARDDGTLEPDDFAGPAPISSPGRTTQTGKESGLQLGAHPLGVL